MALGGKVRGAVGWGVVGPIALVLAGVGCVAVYAAVLGTEPVGRPYRAAVILPLASAVVGGVVSRRKVRGAVAGAAVGLAALGAALLVVFLVDCWIHPTPGGRMQPSSRSVALLILTPFALWVPVGAAVSALVAAVLRAVYGPPPTPPAPPPRPATPEPTTRLWAAVEPRPGRTDG